MSDTEVVATTDATVDEASPAAEVNTGEDVAPSQAPAAEAGAETAGAETADAPPAVMPEAEKATATSVEVETSAVVSSEAAASEMAVSAAPTAAPTAAAEEAASAAAAEPPVGEAVTEGESAETAVTVVEGATESASETGALSTAGQQTEAATEAAAAAAAAASTGIDTARETQNETTTATTSTSAASITTTAATVATLPSPSSSARPLLPPELAGAKISRQQINVYAEGVQASDEGATPAYSFDVVVYRPIVKKPFLGGFRSKTTGLEYHNASTQTYRNPRRTEAERFHRETQTQIQRDHDTNMQQTTVETSTQVPKSGVYIDQSTDVVREAAPYESSADRAARFIHAVITIQKWFRRWQAQREVETLRRAKLEFERWEVECEQRRTEAIEEERENQIYRRVHPRTAEDFDLLYAGLEQWRIEKRTAIDALPEAEQPGAKMALLAEQQKYLVAIDKLKHEANAENAEKRITTFLDRAAGGHKIQQSEYGHEVHVTTPGNKRAHELREVYNLLRVETLRTDERLDALIYLREVVSSHASSRAAKDILGLVKREADLLARGVRTRNLEGLRKRTLNLFVQLLEDPEFNPEARKLLMQNKSAEDHAVEGTYFCSSLRRFLPAQDYEVSPTIVAGPKRSRAAERLTNRGTKRQDNTLYRRLLQRIQAREKRHDDGSQCVFLMTVADLRYLIDTVWGLKSVISEEPELFLLDLPRWDREREWSPWNCVLLSQEEADAHCKLPDVGAAYGDFLVARVRQKHILARNHFKTLIGHLRRARRQIGVASDSAPQLPNYGGNVALQSEA